MAGPTLYEYAIGVFSAGSFFSLLEYLFAKSANNALFLPSPRGFYCKKVNLLALSENEPLVVD